MNTADPLWFGVECIRWFYVTEKPEKQSSNTFTEEETAAVRQVLVERIKSSAADSALLFDPDVQQECSTRNAQRPMNGGALKAAIQCKPTS